MLRRAFIFLFAFSAAATVASTADRPEPPPFIPEFHQAVEASLTPELWSLGPALEDRAAWEKLAKLPRVAPVLEQAAALAQQTFVMPDETLYVKLAKDKKSVYDAYEAAVTKLRRELGTLFIAYGCTLNPAYPPKIAEMLTIFCRLRSWTKPSSDRDLGNFNGSAPTIDLRSSRLAWQLAIIGQKMGTRLDPAIAKQLRDELRRRIIRIYRDTITGQVRYTYTESNDNLYWLNARHNWNAVCLAGVIGVILAVEDDPVERKMLIARALDYSENYLRGFPPDGYCSEGPRYWTYGFNHYMLTAMMISDVTGGRLRLMRRPEVANPAFYPDRIRLTETFFPALADCPFDIDVKSELLAMRDELIGQPTFRQRELAPARSLELHDFLAGARYLDFPRDRMPAAPDQLPAHSFFPDGGVAVLRPGGTACRLTALFKGGSNAEVHNHNDVGSFILLLDGIPMAIDPGSEVYSGRTFSGKRYESKVLNSFGHSVPRLGEALQVAGPGTAAQTLELRMEPHAPFRWQLNIAAAYRLPTLAALTRTFSYDRTGAGRVTVEDHVEFKTPERYEFALVTIADWRQTGTNELELTREGRTLRVHFEAGVPLRIAAEAIKEKQPVELKLTRIAVATATPVEKIDFRAVFTPAPEPK